MDDYEKQVQDQKSASGREEADRKIVIQSLGRHISGRKFLWWILEQGNTFGGSYRVDGTGRGDPLASAYVEGRRAYGLDIMHEIIRCSPELFTTMMKEHNVRPTDTDAKSDSDASADS